MLVSVGPKSFCSATRPLNWASNIAPQLSGCAPICLKSYAMESAFEMIGVEYTLPL